MTVYVDQRCPKCYSFQNDTITLITTENGKITGAEAICDKCGKVDLNTIIGDDYEVIK